jgi:hypothetical protein
MVSFSFKNANKIVNIATSQYEKKGGRPIALFSYRLVNLITSSEYAEVVLVCNRTLALTSSSPNLLKKAGAVYS